MMKPQSSQNITLLPPKEFSSKEITGGIISRAFESLLDGKHWLPENGWGESFTVDGSEEVG
jgi:hypothetical protein